MKKLMVLAALLVVGCGSEQPRESAKSGSTPPLMGTAANAVSASACDILTQADAEAALGHAVTTSAEAVSIFVDMDMRAKRWIAAMSR